MTVVNFAVAMAIPRLTARLGQAVPLAAGVTLTLIGMAWLSRVSVPGSYWDAVARPMVPVGAGQGLAFAPMTSAGIAGDAGDDAGAASGMVNTFHQVGMALGLGVLVAASTHAGQGLTASAAVLTAHVSTALTAGSVLLTLCLPRRSRSSCRLNWRGGTATPAGPVGQPGPNGCWPRRGRTDRSSGLIGSGGGLCHYLEEQSLPDRGQSGLPEDSGDEPRIHDDERRK